MTPAARPWFVALAGGLTIATSSPRGAAAAETLQIEVRETAGIQRFDYPIAVKLTERAMGDGDTHFRLRELGRPVPAQFRQEAGDAQARGWWLDFSVSIMPNELRVLTLEYGPDVVADPEPGGLEMRQTPDKFEIRNGAHLSWTIGRDLVELVKSVDAGELHYLRPEGIRLGMDGPNGTLSLRAQRMSPPTVTRAGPLAVAVRYEMAPDVGPTEKVRSTVDLTFPVSKSWVQVDWRIEDQRHLVRSLRADIAQNVDPPTDDRPTLVDFGASSLVYMSLTPGMVGTLQARTAAASSSAESTTAAQPSWEVLRGQQSQPQPFVVQSSLAQRIKAEGWAHVMDRSRCLALAVGEFGRGGDDSLKITAEGAVSIVRRFHGKSADAPATRSLRFWLHFIGFPPHVTAATSPQSMLSPLAVRVSKP